MKNTTLVALLAGITLLGGCILIPTEEQPETTTTLQTTTIPEEIIVRTDKTEYDPGEDIRITITNNLKKTIYSHIGSNTPEFSIKHVERKTNGAWEKLSAWCQYPHCIYDIDPPMEINPGQSESFAWDQIIFINGTDESVQAGEGVYRLSILYKVEGSGWVAVYSNEFRIKAASLANPAAVYCKEQGYELESREDESGNQYSVCIFPDGSECNQWAFFRGECYPQNNEECGKIEVCEDCPTITYEELEQGWYWGNCDQKKKYTPGDWGHTGEGTRSAKWVKSGECDCAQERECSLDSDCVPAQCCHPTSCVSKEEAPDCSGIGCTEECKPGTMDCGQGYCACVNGECVAVIGGAVI